ncbi:isochorismatase family protein, partial [Acinetobacter baumannii]|uniref:isochorismatase family protein n=1 Tax=Acinetobacter baumannii TaxID=470 RepID=UPI000B217718
SQVLWPKHCIQGTHDAVVHPALTIQTAQMIIQKGSHAHIDSYSAFMAAEHSTMKGLTGSFKERGFDTVYLVGIATEFCVAWTALDAV